MRTLTNFGLLLISIILGAITIPIGFAANFVILFIKANFKAWWRRLGDYFLIFAVAIDVTGNVALGPLLNLILITKGGYKFGNRKETISSVLGKNKKTMTLKPLGSWLSNVLDKIDPNHVLNAIDNNV